MTLKFCEASWQENCYNLNSNIFSSLKEENEISDVFSCLGFSDSIEAERIKVGLYRRAENDITGSVSGKVFVFLWGARICLEIFFSRVVLSFFHFFFEGSQVDVSKMVLKI